MNWEEVSGWAQVATAVAQVGTFVVVGGSVIAALVQLRHMRGGNQLQALLSLERDFRGPQLQAALTYVQEHLPQRLEDPAYRRDLDQLGFIDPEVHPEMVACNWLNEMGTLVKRNLVSEGTFMDLFGRLIVHCWKHLSPAIAIMRRKRGQAQYHDFEYLAVRAAAWLQRNPQGTAPRPFARAEVADPWLAIDTAPGAER
ncbi:MAG TPA: hypothetical protein VNU22_13900 [Candidatus Acidoferrum sp.]|nr:hypothetical protein [Candidatus Acidoferrum sp.]